MRHVNYTALSRARQIISDKDLSDTKHPEELQEILLDDSLWDHHPNGSILNYDRVNKFVKQSYHENWLMKIYSPNMATKYDFDHLLSYVYKCVELIITSENEGRTVYYLINMINHQHSFYKEAVKSPKGVKLKKLYFNGNIITQNLRYYSFELIVKTDIFQDIIGEIEINKRYIENKISKIYKLIK